MEPSLQWLEDVVLALDQELVAQVQELVELELELACLEVARDWAPDWQEAPDWALEQAPDWALEQVVFLILKVVFPTLSHAFLVSSCTDLSFAVKLLLGRSLVESDQHASTGLGVALESHHRFELVAETLQLDRSQVVSKLCETHLHLESPSALTLRWMSAWRKSRRPLTVA